MKVKKLTTKRKILYGSALISIILLILVYLGLTVYFSNRFFFHTKINGIDVSQKTAVEAEQLLAEETSAYAITIKGRNDLLDTISAADIQLSYIANDTVKQYVKKQNPFLWFISVFEYTEKEIKNCSSYDEELFDKTVSALCFFNKKNKVEPKNASIEYVADQGFYIVNEKRGSTVKKKKLKEALKNAIEKGKTDFSIEKEECYKEPEVTSTSEKLQSLFEKVCKYGNAKITYTFGKKKEVVDASKIKDWLDIDVKKMTVKVKKDGVRTFVDYIASTYNTFGKTRSFRASSGKKVKVYGGDYGWLLDRDKETTQLMKKIKKGEVCDKKPAYVQTAASHGKKDWGKTYVEVNLSRQHLWFYKKGKLIVESDFVSGNLSKNNGTPQGVYPVIYKKRNAILGALSNASYRTPVSYWMPFNGGIGLHDAKWRSSFGGSIYKTNGSHGCVNLPPYVAAKIYAKISAGDAVLCYYES